MMGNIIGKIDSSVNHKLNESEIYELYELANLEYMESAEDMQKSIEEIRNFLESKFLFLNFNQ